MSNSGQNPEQETARKPSPFDNLSREELVKKCKGLLGIAQKAKQVKDEYVEENRRLKEQLSHFETQKNADKECIKAMQEVADSYMDQKLQATMKVDQLEKQLEKLTTQLMHEQTAHEKQSEELRATIEQLKGQLTTLEQNVEVRGYDDASARVKELEEENEKLEKERVMLEQELIKAKGSQKPASETTLTPREEKLIRKLKLYKAKVQEINAKLLLLKSDRKILLKTVREYSEQVPKWQKELVNASNVLFDKIRTIELEKSDVVERLSEQQKLATDLHAKNVELSRRLAELTTQVSQVDGNNEELSPSRDESLIDGLKKQLEELQIQHADIVAENQRKLSEYEAKVQLDSIERENLQKHLQEANQLVSECETKSQTQADQLEEASKRAQHLEEQVKSLQTKLESNTEAASQTNLEQETLAKELANLKERLEISEREKLQLVREREELVEKIENLTLQHSEAQGKLAAIENQNEQLRRQLADLESNAAKMASEGVTHEKKLEENQAVVQKLIIENQNLETQLAQLAEKLKASVAKSKQAEQRNKLLEKETDEVKARLEELAAEKLRISDELKQAEAHLQTKVEELTLQLDEKDTLAGKLEEEKQKLLAEATNKLEKLRESSDTEMQQRVSSLQAELSSVKESHDVLRSENNELLSELKEINEILKERGEVINLQLSKIGELQEKLSRAETTDVQPLRSQIEQLQRLLSEKDTELERQREELAAARDRSNVSFDAQSDVMSTSTISRVEDAARMREIDESFEEKYIKLRSLAVKLKKKVAEQTVLLQKYEKEASLAGPAEPAVELASKNLQSLQAENDRLQDQLEAVRQEAEKLREELDRKTVELATHVQMQKDAEGSTSKDRTALESAIREYQTQIQNLKREKEAFQLAKREIDAENQRLKASLHSREKELADEHELQKELKSELDRTKLAVKKANVLSLEMEAYERSLSELNTKLESKKTLVKELEGTIDLQEQSMKSLKQQVALLEESLESQQKHSRELKHEADTQQGKLRQSEHQRMELTGQLEELREEHDRLKQRVENNRVELEQVAAEKERTCGALEMEKSSLLKKTLTLEEELGGLRKAVEEKQQEVEDVRTEFASYKIRAQSVLRQNQSKDSSREKELEEELSQTQRSLEAIEGKQQALLKQTGELSRTIEELRSEKERTHNRCKELLALLEESRLQNESLLEESRRVNREHQETLKTQRIQSETLIQCYKKQLEEQQEAHRRQVEQLQEQTTAPMWHRSSTEATATAAVMVVDGPNGPSRAAANLQNNNSFMSLSHHPAGRPAGAGFTDEQRINLLLMEREEGEGSESTSSLAAAGTGGGAGSTTGTLRRKLSSSSVARGRGNRDVIPLDELLNSSFDDSASVLVLGSDGESEQQGGSSFFGRESAASPTVELQQTREQLSKQESRVRHLTAVLAEAEQDLAKLTQLNELLKEEVRRQQRSIEREAHVHNSEYLKNVIFKFITLSNGDERSRLVPVLNTILKLSPEETQKLQNVAKGSDAGSRGWTGLLWS